MTILAMVQAEKEGNIESKMIRARQMEEIREARKAEAENREAGRKEKLVRTYHTSNTQTHNANDIAGGCQGRAPQEEEQEGRQILGCRHGCRACR